MHLHYTTKLTAASIAFLTVTVFLCVAVKSQEPAQDKAQDKPAAAAPAQSPAQNPSPATKEPRKMGTELDGPVILTNTDLITLTVTVTDTYGRYVSGLSKGAFAVFDNKTQQEITYFSDDDSPVSVGVIFDVSGSMSGDKVKRA